MLPPSPPGLMRMILGVIGIQLRTTPAFFHETFASERVMTPPCEWVLIRQRPNDWTLVLIVKPANQFRIQEPGDPVQTEDVDCIYSNRIPNWPRAIILHHLRSLHLRKWKEHPLIDVWIKVKIVRVVRLG